MYRTILVLAAGLLAAGCGPRDPYERLSLSLPPLQDGEVNRYRLVLVAGPPGEEPAVLGDLVTRLEFGWADGIPAYRLEHVTRTLTGDIETTDSSFVKMHQADLRPISSFRSIRVGEALLTAVAAYGEASVSVSTRSRTGEEQRQLLPAGPGAYDAGQLLFLGRALRLDPGRAVSVKVAEPMGPPPGGNVRSAEFRALGEEPVTVPAGGFRCRKFELTVGDTVLTLWYEMSGPGRLVRKEAAEAGIVLELLAPDRGGH